MHNEKECIILMGIQASGKSTFYVDMFRDTHVCINLDMLRDKMREKKLFEFCLDTNQSCVIDNSNITKPERAKYISLAKQNGYNITGYFFNADIDSCIQRNNKRENKVAVSSIVSRHNKIETPSLSEGFNDLYFVSIVNGEFSISDFDEALIENKQPLKNIVSRRIAIPVSDKIDWRFIIKSIAWNNNIFCDIKKAEDVDSPLVLLEVVGDEKDIVSYSKLLEKELQKVISKIPRTQKTQGYFEVGVWGNRYKRILKFAYDKNIKIKILDKMRNFLKVTVFYEVEGLDSDIKEFLLWLENYSN